VVVRKPSKKVTREQPTGADDGSTTMISGKDYLYIYAFSVSLRLFAMISFK